ncbi:MAG: hypothetical protein AAGD13_21720 [Pseudomonadota bacterium]
MQRNRLPVLLGIPALALLLAACAGPSAYAPATDREGFTDTALEENRFRVTFAGNTKTPRQTVENYLLYRAAEVTLESGHDWFQVAERDTEVQTRFRGLSTGFGPFFTSSGLVLSSTKHSGRASNRYEAFANIVVFDGEKPADDPDAYDAKSVIESLGPLIVRPSAL